MRKTKISNRFISRICLILVCMCVALQSAAGITIKNKDISLQEALAKVKEQTGVYVMYENGVVDAERHISLDLQNVSLPVAMDAICAKGGLSYEIKGEYVLVTRAPRNHGEAGYIYGRVTDEEGNPLAGVSVIRTGKFSGTVTDAEGFYSIQARKGDHLQFRYIGMHPVEVAVVGDNAINIKMENDAQNLQEVQVLSTGYQSLPRERATGAFSTLSAEDLKKLPSANVVQRMEGQVPGMKVSVLSGDRSFVYTGGALQSANSSTRTVGNNDYDMAIRGVSTLRGEKMPLLVVDGVICDFDISSLDPNTIENITILKDAAAASIWGSRAANGVIVVTTKKGEQAMRPKVSFGMTLTTQDKPDLKSLNRLSSAATLEYEKEIVDKGYIYETVPNSYYTASTVYPEGSLLAMKLKNGSITQAEYDARVKELSSVDNFDQIKDYFMQRAFSQQYNASVSGGTTNSTYFYSMSYAKENPYAKGDSGSRLNINLSNSWKLFNWATLSTNFAGTFLKYKNNGMGIGTILGGTTKVMPYTALVDADGKGVEQDVYDPTWVASLGSAYKRWTYNYLEEVQLGSHTQRSDNYSANINLLIPIVWGISSQTTYALERGNTTIKNWYDPETYQMRNMLNYYTPAGATTNTLGIRNGGLSDQHSRDRNWTFREQLNYDGHYSGIHRISALAGVELRQTYVEQGSSTIWGYNPETGISDANIDMSYNQSYNTIAGYPTSFNGGGYPNEVNRRRRYLSYFANAGYTLLDRYYVSASVRYDDYNNFGLDRKYRAKPFYSFGAKWNLSREEFLEQTTWISNLALRATYGVNGNISLDAYPFTKISLTSNWITGQPSASITALANPQLRWESTKTANFGLDFGLFNYRLTGNIEYYLKRSRDLIYEFPFSSAVVGNIGNSQLNRNAVAINGQGFEASLRGIAYQDSDWNVEIGANMSWNKNKVLSNTFFKEEQYLSYMNYMPTYIGTLEGYSTDKLFVFRYAGLNENGQPLVYNKDGEIMTPADKIESVDDLLYVGHQNPTVFGGVTLNVRWKNFTLYSLFTYQFGGHFMRPTLSGYITNTYSRDWAKMTADIADRWREPGDELKTNVPGMTSDYIAVSRYKYSDINVEKSDYLRWRTVSLTYSFSNSLISKIGIGGANIGIAMSNIGLLWKSNKAGIDPDYCYGMNGFSVAPGKSYTVNLSVNF